MTVRDLTQLQTCCCQMYHVPSWLAPQCNVQRCVLVVFFSGGIIIAIIVNPLERKLCNGLKIITHPFYVSTLSFIVSKSYFIENNSTNNMLDRCKDCQNDCRILWFFRQIGNKVCAITLSRTSEISEKNWST